ncbi:MAG: hypothetical protein JNM17_26250 [Archangium sp.]|nr:hypothetical protein [Archangium sp.]
MPSRNGETSLLVARHAERAVLDEALHSRQAELLALYGRRRVGKTFLIRQVLAEHICFELVGMHEVSLRTQLQSFATSLARAHASPAALAPPHDWFAAFEQLRAFLSPRLTRLNKKQNAGKLVVFFDEVPWLASRRSGFLSAFEHFWNAWAVQQPKLLVVLCGSAASWMLENLVRQRGGLHNRVTRRLRVEPFSLADTEELLLSRGVRLGRYQTLLLTMALGGVPHYLTQVRRGESAVQAIDRLCFTREGPLRTEFEHLYASLFEQADRHEAVVRALAKKRRGLTRTALLEAAKLGSGGAATRVLDELEEAGFILQMPRLGRGKREAVYWLSDEYSLFYLTWIEGRRGDVDWLRRQGTPAWRAWSGLAFEALALKHVRAIKAALGIAGVETSSGSWERRGTRDSDGAQIDLIIERADACLNLCELKFSEGPFTVDKAYARELRRKCDVFRAETRSRKALFLTLITTWGVNENEHSRGLVTTALTMDALFTRTS